MTNEEINQLLANMPEMPIFDPCRVELLNLDKIISDIMECDTEAQNVPRLRPKNIRCDVGDIHGLKLESVTMNFSDIATPDKKADKPVSGVKSLKKEKKAVGGLF